MEKLEFQIDETASALVRDGATMFVKHELYESIQAPKFQYDFWSTENDPADTDAFFLKAGGTKTSRKFDGTCLEPNLIKVKTAISVPKAVRCQSSSTALIPDDNSILERASVCGSKKVRSTVAKSQDKMFIKGKIVTTARDPCNAPIPLPALEKNGYHRVQQQVAPGIHQSAENVDPNSSHRPQRKRTTRADSKSVTESSISHLAFAASQSLFERKATSESVVLDAQCLVSRQDKGTEIAESCTKNLLVASTSQLDNSGEKNRKRRPSGKNADSFVPKALESYQPFKGRVSRVPRTGAVSLDSESCSELKEVASLPSRNGSRDKVSFSASSKKAAKVVTRRLSSARRIRRISDQSRRRKSSNGVNTAKPRTGNISTAAKSISREAKLARNPPVAERALTCVLPHKPTVNSFVYETEDRASSGVPAHDVAVDGTPDEATYGGRLFEKQHGGCNIESEDGVNSTNLQNVQLQHATNQLKFSDSLSVHEVVSDQLKSWDLRKGNLSYRSAGEVSSDQLQSLDLQQEAVSSTSAGDVPLDPLQSLDLKQVNVSQSAVFEKKKTLNKLYVQFGGDEVSELKVYKAHKQESKFERPENQLLGNTNSKLEICEVNLFDSNHRNTQQIPQECRFGYRLTVELKDFGSRVGGATLVHTCEKKSPRLKSDNADQEGVSRVTEEWQVIQTACGELRDSQFRSCDASPIDEYVAVSSGLKTLDDQDQGVLLNEFRKLRFPQGDEELQDDRMRVLEVKTKFLLYSQRETPELTVEASLSSASEVGFESKSGSSTKFISDDANSAERDKKSHASIAEAPVSKVEVQPYLVKQNKKRKSIEIAPQKSDLRVLIPSNATSVDDHNTVKSALQSATFCSSSLQSPSTGRSTTVMAVGQHKKMRATCPQPFRLRTQERGAFKEVEFNKKVEQHLVANEKAQIIQPSPTVNKKKQGERGAFKEIEFNKKVEQHLVANEKAQIIQPTPTVNKKKKGVCTDGKTEGQISLSTANKEKKMAAVKHSIVPCTDPRGSVKPDKLSQIRATAQQHAEEEIKRMRKNMVPHSQKMPIFDKPFKPHRSTKAPTVPNSPKFQSKTKKTIGATKTQG